MEVYTSDSSDSDSRDIKTLNYSRLNLRKENLDEKLHKIIILNHIFKEIETILLNHNRLSEIPHSLGLFTNLRILDLSSNNLTILPEFIFQSPLITLIAKNNLLTNKSLPKSFHTQTNSLKELNLSGNKLNYFPEQILELKELKYLYLGGNQIKSIVKDIWKVQNLHILSIGGNELVDVPDTVGSLNHLKALILCDNLIENLPASIAMLKNLKSLLLHRNKLKHLPRDIITLKNLEELSLRDNPLIERFVQDMTLNPPTLLELAGRVIKIASIKTGPEDIPRTLVEYLKSANCCVNPKCNGVFFDNRVEHIKFVDFCGKYRVPLLQFLCSSKCAEAANKVDISKYSQASTSGYMMKKVLLG